MIVWSIARRKPGFNVRRRCPSRHSVPRRPVPHHARVEDFRREDGQDDHAAECDGPIGFYQAYPGLTVQDIHALIADSK